MFMASNPALAGAAQPAEWIGRSCILHETCCSESIRPLLRVLSEE